MELLTVLDAPYEVSSEQIGFYHENGFVHQNDVLPARLLEYYRRPITEMVEKLTAGEVPLEKRSTYGKAFLQVMNLWTKHDQIREFVFGKRLARIATDLMGCRGVRVYHDQALYKEPGGGATPWHADQYYWPVSNDPLRTRRSLKVKLPGKLDYSRRPRRTRSLCAGCGCSKKTEHLRQIAYRRVCLWVSCVNGKLKRVVDYFDLETAGEPGSLG